uniref:Uncharacterized protein n=1 Tax=Aegilops tauschii subsp. strangulata TaxID=200361 RepID=A0A453PSN4_AEGTS
MLCFAHFLRSILAILAIKSDSEMFLLLFYACLYALLMIGGSGLIGLALTSARTCSFGKIKMPFMEIVER